MPNKKKLTVTPLYLFNNNQLTPPFAHGCDLSWLSEDQINTQQINSTLNNWLFDRGSLTTRLKQQCQHFEVIVLNAATGILSPQEQHLFKDASLTINFREVLLVCDGVPQVYARSLIPDNTIDSSNVGLRELGNNSLGQILFQAPHAKRGAIEVTSFNQQSSLATLSKELGMPVTHDLWGRRSLFTLQQYPLLVSEVFLPGALAYQELSR